MIASRRPGYCYRICIRATSPRAYFTMFYLTQAFLEGEGLAFSRHSAIIAAFGKQFARTNRVPARFQKYLIEAQALRQSGDYGQRHAVTLLPTTLFFSKKQLALDDNSKPFAVDFTEKHQIPSCPSPHRHHSS